MHIDSILAFGAAMMMTGIIIGIALCSYAYYRSNKDESIHID